MTQFLDFIGKYPFLWPTLLITVWTVFSGILSIILAKWIPRTDEQWTLLYTRKPKVAALANILKTAGFSVPGFFRSVDAFIDGPPPTLPMPKTRDDVKALEAVVLAQVTALEKGAAVPTTIEKAAISVAAPSALPGTEAPSKTAIPLPQGPVT